jgi:hypothetical protein
MPRIDGVIGFKEPSDVRSRILPVMDNHPEHVWSTSTDDLTELALWMFDSRMAVADWFVSFEFTSSEQPVTLNSRFMCWSNRSRSSPSPRGRRYNDSRPFTALHEDQREPRRLGDTPTLRTVRDALLALHDDGLIFGTDLDWTDRGDGKRRRYYGSLKGEEGFAKRIQDRDKFEFDWEDPVKNPRARWRPARRQDGVPLLQNLGPAERSEIADDEPGPSRRPSTYTG